MIEKADVIVVGTGLVGLAAALAFAGAGFATAAVGPVVSATDRRTTAIMTPGLRFLEGQLDPGPLLAVGAPLRVLQIIDGTRRLVRSSPVAFRASEIGEEEFGWNVPNAALLATLDGAVAAHPLISRKTALAETFDLADNLASATLSDGTRLEAPLIVAADGRTSPAREAAGIAVTRRDLPQSALVLSFAHSRGHGFVSTEFHTEHGPFTQVPLPGDRSSLVWVERPARAAELHAMGDEELGAAIEDQMQSMLGRVTVEAGRQLFPLASVLPAHYGANRVALAGEAAHTIPPIGAQGFNLGLADLRELLAVAHGNRADPGSPAALTAYSRARALAVGSRTFAVNLLNHSLLSPHLPVQAARRLGLSALRRSAPLRAFFMREGLEAGGALPPRRSR